VIFVKQVNLATMATSTEFTIHQMWQESVPGEPTATSTVDGLVIVDRTFTYVYSIEKHAFVSNEHPANVHRIDDK
jgi:hypothetical protein